MNECVVVVLSLVISSLFNCGFFIKLIIYFEFVRRRTLSLSLSCCLSFYLYSSVVCLLVFIHRFLHGITGCSGGFGYVVVCCYRSEQVLKMKKSWEY